MTRAKLTRAAIASAIALCFAAPVAAIDNAPIVVAQAAGGSNSQQSSPQTKHGTASAVPSGPEVARGDVTKNAGATGTTATTGTTGTVRSPAATANTARGAPDNTNAIVRTGTYDMDAWVNKHADEHRGRVSRQAYLDEMGRRWDALDRSRQGLTPAEVSRLTGKVDVDHSAPPRTGSDAQAGNMGPSSTKGN